MTAEAIEELIRSLKKNGAPVTYSRVPLSHYTRWDVPLNGASDYSISAILYDDGGLEIAAKLPENAGAYFWHSSIEVVRGVSDQERLKKFSDALAAVLLNKSRVVQKRGLLFWSFSMEIFQDGKWTPLDGVSCLRWGFAVPPIEGRVRVYESKGAGP